MKCLTTENKLRKRTDNEKKNTNPDVVTKHPNHRLTAASDFQIMDDGSQNGFTVYFEVMSQCFDVQPSNYVFSLSKLVCLNFFLRTCDEFFKKWRHQRMRPRWNLHQTLIEKKNFEVPAHLSMEMRVSVISIISTLYLPCPVTAWCAFASREKRTAHTSCPFELSFNGSDVTFWGFHKWNEDKDTRREYYFS